MTEATRGRTMLNILPAGCAALALALAVVPATAQEAGRTKVGTLTCNISPGVGMIVVGTTPAELYVCVPRGAEAARLTKALAAYRPRHRCHIWRPADLGCFCADHAASGGAGRNLHRRDSRRHSWRRSRRQRPGWRLGPHGHLAAVIRVGREGRECCGRHIQHGTCGRLLHQHASKGSTVKSSTVNKSCRLSTRGSE